MKVGVFVSFKEKNERKSKGIKEEANSPIENKAKLKEVNSTAKDENWP